MGKLLNIQDAWDTLGDDQRQFERTVAELKANFAIASKSRKTVDKPYKKQRPSQNKT